MKIAICVGLLASVAVSQFDYPSVAYTVGGPQILPETGQMVTLPFDTVLATQYFHTKSGISVIGSHAYKARIDCLDVFIPPATQFQTCHQSRDANKK